jgi:outer membrane lipoprotein carrier protein
MRKTILIAIIGCLLMGPFCAFGESLSPDEIMDRLEARYNVQGIFVRFHQTSTLKALDITDTADGQIYIRQPGCMRWEYEIPEKQSIITDGETVWLYRPDDNQVMTEPAETFFGEGKGGAFLADMTLIRKYFSVALEAEDPAGYYVLKLTPDPPSGDIQSVTLNVSRENFSVLQVVTENNYGDETRLTFEAPEFGRELDDELFSFTPPEGAEIFSLGE